MRDKTTEILFAKGLTGLILCVLFSSCTTAPRQQTPASVPSLDDAVASVQPSGPRQGRSDFQLLGIPQQAGLVRGFVPDGTTSLLLNGTPVRMTAQGEFLIAFDRDSKPEAILTAIRSDGTKLVRTLAVAPRSWDIQSLPTLRKGTPSTPEGMAIRSAEMVQINAARNVNAQSDGWRQMPFLWPTMGRISGIFGSQRIYAGEPGAYHSGVDVARPTGTPIIAPADGVVVLAATTPFTLEGHLLMIDHGMGLVSAFLHLSRLDVAKGDVVKRGQMIGAIGTTGRSTGPHMHWGMTLNKIRIDPQPLVGPMPAAAS